MKLTGRQLFEWWVDSMDRPWREWWNRAEAQSAYLPMFDALAEKLNGMMAGEATHSENTFCSPTGDECLCQLHRILKDCPVCGPSCRARHHATCPYRHGKGDCEC